MSQNAPAGTATLSSCILRSVAAADGALERRPRVSPRARRLYDSQAILVPAEVDDDTGYRRYRESQLVLARLVSGG